MIANDDTPKGTHWQIAFCRHDDEPQIWWGTYCYEGDLDRATEEAIARLTTDFQDPDAYDLAHPRRVAIHWPGA